MHNTKQRERQVKTLLQYYLFQPYNIMFHIHKGAYATLGRTFPDLRKCKLKVIDSGIKANLEFTDGTTVETTCEVSYV